MSSAASKPQPDLGLGVRSRFEEVRPIGKKRGLVRKSRSTVIDVARLAGVSVASVSRVFSGTRNVAEEIRERVLAAAEKVGYAPNMAAQALKRGCVSTVGVALSPHSLMGEFYAETLHGFHEVIEAQRLRVILSIVPEQSERQAWVEELILAGWCSAVAVHVGLVTDRRRLAQLGTPVTILNYRPPDGLRLYGLGAVGFDNTSGILEAVRHLAMLGHKAIAYLGAPEPSLDGAERNRAFRTGMQETGLRIEERWTVRCEFEDGFESGRAAMERILRGPKPFPTAVVCASDNIALGAIRSAIRWGLSVPRQLSVTGFDDVSWACSANPPLTTVRHKGVDLGRATARAMLDTLGAGKAPAPVLLPAELVVRESTAPPGK